MSESGMRSAHKKYKKHKKKFDRSLPLEYERRKLYMDEEDSGAERRKTVDIVKKPSKSKGKYDDLESGSGKEYVSNMQKKIFAHLKPQDEAEEREELVLPKRLKRKIDQDLHKSNVDFLHSHKITIRNSTVDSDDEVEHPQKCLGKKPHKSSRRVEEASSQTSSKYTDNTSKKLKKHREHKDRKKIKAVRRIRHQSDSNSDNGHTQSSLSHSSLRRVFEEESSDEEGRKSKKYRKQMTKRRSKLRTPPSPRDKEDSSVSYTGSEDEKNSHNSSVRLYSDCISPIADRSVLSRIKLKAKSRNSFTYDSFERKSHHRHSDGLLSKSFHVGAERKRSFHDSSLGDSFLSANKNYTGLFSRELKYGVHTNWAEDRLESARNSIIGKVTSNLPFVDTHCHIDFLFKKLPYAKSYDDYIDESFFRFPRNFEGCIADWCQPSLYGTAKPFLRGNKKCKIWAAFGCHPHFVNTYDSFVEKEILDTIQNNANVIAIGEMGLDYSDRFGQTDHELQKKVFIRQLKIAGKLQVPLVIHCRDADPDLVKIMKEYVPHDTKIHRHCLTTEEKDVRELLDYFPNCYVGFTNLLSNKSAYRARSAASTIPLKRILLETDSPYFIPRCVSEATNSAAKFSHSGMALCVAKELASLKRISTEEVLKQTRKNVTSVYGI